MSFIDFVHKYKSKNKATSNIKIQQFLSSLGFTDVGIHSRDGPFKTDVGIGNLHPFIGGHWVAYINQNYFDSYDCICPTKLSKFISKQSGYCLYSEHKIQGLTNRRDFYFASYCLYIF